MSVNQFLNGKLNLIAGAGGGSVIADDNTFTGTTAEVEAAIADGLIEDDTIVFITDDFEEMSDNKIEYVTQEQYDALPESKLTDNVEYRITDKGIDSVSASNVTYDNSVSGLEAVNVQGAVDELKEDVSTLGESLDNINEKFLMCNDKTLEIQSMSTHPTVRLRGRLNSNGYPTLEVYNMDNNGDINNYLAVFFDGTKFYLQGIKDGGNSVTKTIS